MNKINFTVKIERTVDCNYNLDRILDFFELSQAEWDSFADDTKQEFLYQYIEDEIEELVDNYDTEDIDITLNPDGNS